MKQRWTLALSFALVVALAGGASAQTAQRGDVGIYFDPAGTDAETSVIPNVPFQMYVISTKVPDGQNGFEFSILIDDRIIVINEDVNPPGAFDFGTDPSFPLNDKNYLVGTGGQCLTGDTTILVTLTGIMLPTPDPTDLTFCLGAATPTSFSPAGPGYLACSAAGDLRPYTPAYEGCAVANSTDVPAPVSVESSTWGAVKARY